MIVIPMIIISEERLIKNEKQARLQPTYRIIEYCIVKTVSLFGQLVCTLWRVIDYYRMLRTKLDSVYLNLSSLRTFFLEQHIRYENSFRVYNEEISRQIVSERDLTLKNGTSFNLKQIKHFSSNLCSVDNQRFRLAYPHCNLDSRTAPS